MLLAILSSHSRAVSVLLGGSGVRETASQGAHEPAALLASRKPETAHDAARAVYVRPGPSLREIGRDA